MIGTIPIHIIHEVKSLDLGLGDKVPNQEIGELLDRTLLLGGKRFRPLLCYLMADFFELDIKEVGIFARAIEMTHSATLAHDDVIDQATERRNKPSINVVSSNKKAILSGDYLLAQTMLELSQTGDIRYIQELSMVLRDLVDGEWLQMQNIFSKKVTREDIKEVAIKKTASAITWCCVTPAIKSESYDEVLELTRSFGRKLGLAFQEIDDAIDFRNDLDKDQLQDIKNGILNSVTFELTQINEDLIDKLANTSYEELLYNPPWTHEELEEAVRTVRVKAQTRLDECKNDLKRILELEKRSHHKRAQRALNTLHTVLDELAKRKK